MLRTTSAVVLPAAVVSVLGRGFANAEPAIPGYKQSLKNLNEVHNTGPLRSVEEQGLSTTVQVIGFVLFIWYVVVLSLANLGVVELFLKFRSAKKVPRINTDSLEGVTILRPLKGIDPEVETCLESSLLQYYPQDKYEVLFCVESSNDSVIPLVKHLLAKYPHKNARLLIGDENSPDHFGPNPKINNLAKGFVEAKNDIVWVMDSNVWACRGALIRSVHALNNSLDNNRPTFDPVTGKGRKVKVVHHLPLVVTLKSSRSLSASAKSSLFSNLGCKLDEVFMKTSHAKFYAAFNKLAVAPCVNGKSNMYRRSDIDLAVQKIGEKCKPSINGKSGILGNDAAYYGAHKGYGIRYFSKFIGEDNMIAIALWDIGGRTGLTGDSVLQPLGGSSNNFNNNGLKDYILRRMRWLRVRRYMVLAATLLEPTTESIVAGIYGTFGVSVMFFNQKFSLLFLLFHFAIWFVTDYFQFHILLKYSAMEDPLIESLTAFDGDSTISLPISTESAKTVKPYFTSPYYNGFTDQAEVKNSYSKQSKSVYRNLKQWSLFWFLREVLALPIWIYAMIGTNIDWRGRPFIIKSDLTAEEI